MIYIIIAQIARASVIWTTNKLGRKVLKTIAIGSITFYLVRRAKRIKDYEERKFIAYNPDQITGSSKKKDT